MTTIMKKLNRSKTDIAVILFLLSIIIKIGIFYTFIDVKNYIDIQELYIPPTVYGDPIILQIKRTIHKNFYGGYRVDIRDDINTSFCSTGDISLSYRSDAPLMNPLTLNYWAGGGSCTGRVPQDLVPNKYSIYTCHYVKNPWYIFTIKESCINTILEILPKNTEGEIE